MQRLRKAAEASNYDLDHIPSFIKRELYFQAFDNLCKAFQGYSPILSVSNIERNEINTKVKMLRELLNNLALEE